MKNLNLTTAEQLELENLLEELNQIIKIAEKSRKEKIMREFVGVLIFLLTGSVMIYIESSIIGYLVWLALYGFLSYYIFGVRKNALPEYNDCIQAARNIVSDCVKIIEHTKIVEIEYPNFYIEKYNKLIRYFPDLESKTLKSLIYPKNKK